MRVYITGMIPPVCHTDRNCFGIIFNPKEFEVKNLSDIPSHYEMCIFCIPSEEDNLTAGQRARVEELKTLLKQG